MSKDRILINLDTEEWMTEKEWEKVYNDMQRDCPELLDNTWGQSSDFWAVLNLRPAVPNVPGDPDYNPGYGLGMRPKYI